MSRDWKIGAQVQMPESLSKIELTKVTYEDDSGRVTVAGRIYRSEDPEINGNLLDVRVGFDGERVPVLQTIGDASWDVHRGAREFTTTAKPVQSSAKSIEVRIGRSAVTAALE